MPNYLTILDAKLFDNPIGQEKLKEAIEEKGVVVHVNNSIVKYDDQQDLGKLKSTTLEFNAIVNQTCGVEECADAVACSNLIYGVGSMVIPYKDKKDSGPPIKTYKFFTGAKVQFKVNSRSSSLQMKETDVGRNNDQFRRRKRKRRKAYLWDLRVA